MNKDKQLSVLGAMNSRHKTQSVHSTKENRCFPVFINLANQKLLMVGAGKVALRRIRILCEFTDQLTVISPEVLPEIEKLPVRILRRSFEDADLEGMSMVFLATDDSTLNSRISESCRRKGIPVNNAGDKSRCDFNFPDIYLQDGTVIAANSGGDHHKTKEIMDKIKAIFTADKHPRIK